MATLEGPPDVLVHGQDQGAVVVPFDCGGGDESGQEVLRMSQLRGDMRHKILGSIFIGLAAAVGAMAFLTSGPLGHVVSNLQTKALMGPFPNLVSSRERSGAHEAELNKLVGHCVGETTSAERGVVQLNEAMRDPLVFMEVRRMMRDPETLMKVKKMMANPAILKHAKHIAGDKSVAISQDLEALKRWRDIFADPVVQEQARRIAALKTGRLLRDRKTTELETNLPDPKLQQQVRPVSSQMVQDLNGPGQSIASADPQEQAAHPFRALFATAVNPSHTGMLHFAGSRQTPPQLQNHLRRSSMAGTMMVPVSDDSDSSPISEEPDMSGLSFEERMQILSDNPQFNPRRKNAPEEPVNQESSASVAGAPMIVDSESDSSPISEELDMAGLPLEERMQILSGNALEEPVNQESSASVAVAPMIVDSESEPDVSGLSFEQRMQILADNAGPTPPVVKGKGEYDEKTLGVRSFDLTKTETSWLSPKFWTMCLEDVSKGAQWPDFEEVFTVLWQSQIAFAVMIVLTVYQDALMESGVRALLEGKDFMTTFDAVFGKELAPLIQASKNR